MLQPLHDTSALQFNESCQCTHLLSCITNHVNIPTYFPALQSTSLYPPTFLHYNSMSHVNMPTFRNLSVGKMLAAQRTGRSSSGKSMCRANQGFLGSAPTAEQAGSSASKNK